MATILNPLEHPEIWDRVIIGGVISPFMCEVSEWTRKNQWDEKVGKGSQGATLTYTGRPGARGSIKFKLTEPEDFDAWLSYLPLFKYDPTRKAAQAIDIYHPSLAEIDITSVVCEEIGNVVHEGGQEYSRTVKFIEYFPPPKKSAVGTPNGSIDKGNANTPGTTPESAQDEYDKQIQNLLNQASQP